MVNSKIEIKYMLTCYCFSKWAVTKVAAYVICKNNHAFLRNINVILNALLYIQQKYVEI
jgi:hypothetical protein